MCKVAEGLRLDKPMYSYKHSPGNKAAPEGKDQPRCVATESDVMITKCMKDQIRGRLMVELPLAHYLIT